MFLLQCRIKREINRIYFIVIKGKCKTKINYKIKYIDARLYINKDGHFRLLFLLFYCYFLPSTAGRTSDTRKPVRALITAPIITAGIRCPVSIPTMTATAEGVSPK